MSTSRSKTAISSKSVQQTRNIHDTNVGITTPFAFFMRGFTIQLPAVITIILSDVLIRNAPGSDSFVVIVLLAVLVYTALHAGLKHGLMTAALFVIYSYYVIGMSAEGPWFSLETLQRGAVIAIAFPVLAFVIGRLKERNDALLLGEKNARKAVEASERQLRFMAESMPQKIFTVKPNGDSDYTNPQWQEYMENPLAKDGIADWSGVVHPDDLKENTELWTQSLKSGEPFQFEHRLKRRIDCKYIWHITRARALRDEAGVIMTWIGSSTDIEDIRRTRKLEADTARLIKQRAELMELNKAKDEFISLASHQLRTPATGVKQYVNMAIDGYGGKPSPTLRTFLEKANESNNRQLSIIDDLLKVAQIDAGKVVLRKETVDIGPLIAGIIHEQASKFSDRNQTIQFNLPKTKVKVDADMTKLRMVIENVIDNASKYTPEGKVITVRVTKSDGVAKIRVKDDGVGIARRDIEKVFQKFLRIDNPMSMKVGGTGLGLYWVRKVVELHKGTITVESKLNHGSTFTISLPLK